MATKEQQATPPAGWYDNPTGTGERYWDGAKWTDEYRQPEWTVVKLEGPHASGAPPFRSPAICVACGAPAGEATLDKGNTDAGHVIATLSFPLCDRCAAIHEQGRKEHKDEWKRVDGAVSFKFDSRGDKATFRFRNAEFAEGFREATLNPPKPASEELLLHTIDAHRGRFTGDTVSDCAVSPDSSWIVSVSYDKKVKLWDARSGAELRTLEGFKQPLGQCVISPDGTWIASLGVSANMVEVWDATSGAAVCSFSPENKSVQGCAVSPDGSWVVSSSRKELVVWDPRTGEELRRLGESDVARVPRAVGPDGAWILVSADKDLQLVDPDTGAELRTMSGHRKKVTACAVSPDGSRIVSGSKDGTLKVWDPTSGTELLAIDGHNASVSSCALSPDGAWILSVGGDGFLRISDARTGAEIAAMRLGLTAAPESCAWSPDGAWFVAGDREGRLKIWDARIFEAAP